MDWLVVSEAVALVVVILIAIPIAWLLARRNWLGRQGGTFDCCIRDSMKPKGKWALGFGRYNGNLLQWFRAVSPSAAPRAVFDRSTMMVGSQRAPSQAEAVMVGDGARVIALTTASGRTWELAMPVDALTGLLAWLESAPPGESRQPI